MGIEASAEGTDLGPLVYEWRPSSAEAKGAVAMGVVALVASPAWAYFFPEKHGYGALAATAVLGVLLILAGLVQLRQARRTTAICREGLRTAAGRRAAELAFADVRTLRFSREHRVRFAYKQLTVKLLVEGPEGAEGGHHKFKFNLVTHPEMMPDRVAALEFVAQQSAEAIAARWMEALARGETVKWTGGCAITPEGVKLPGGETLAWAELDPCEVVDEFCRIARRGERARHVFPEAAVNLLPGTLVIARMRGA